MKRVTTIGKISRALCAGTLMILYFFSAIGPASFHELFHRENKAALHIDDNEKDPCHRKLFHNDTQAGCKHNSHVSGQVKCPVCVSLIYKDHLQSFATPETLLSPAADSYNLESFSITDRNPQHLSARAPPAAIAH